MRPILVVYVGFVINSCRINLYSVPVVRELWREMAKNGSIMNWIVISSETESSFQ